MRSLVYVCGKLQRRLLAKVPNRGLALSAMNAEARPTDRRDALAATIALGVLGVLWIVLRLYWQGAILLAAAGLLAYFCVVRATARSDAPETMPEPPPKRTTALKGSRARKKKRRK